MPRGVYIVNLINYFSQKLILPGRWRGGGKRGEELMSEMTFGVPKDTQVPKKGRYLATNARMVTRVSLGNENLGARLCPACGW